MATKNIVPRATGEGSLGTTDKKWASVYANEVNVGGTALTSKLASVDSSISTIQSSVGGKVDTSTYNTKMTSLDSSISELSSGKANIADVYSKTDADALLEEKVDTDNIYSLEEIEASSSLSGIVPNADTIKWKYLNATSGAGKIGLPSSYQEICVCVNCSGYSWTFYVPKKYITQWSGSGTYRGGYYGDSGDNWNCKMRITGGLIYIDASTMAGVDTKNATAFYVFYR